MKYISETMLESGETTMLYRNIRTVVNPAKVNTMIKNAANTTFTTVINAIKSAKSLPVNVKNMAIRMSQEKDTATAQKLWQQILNTPDLKKSGPEWEELKALYHKVQGRRISRMGDGVPLKALGQGNAGVPGVEKVRLNLLSSYFPEYENLIQE